jgi:NADPH:quinone reductase-like Zn-dependent oxidoreductase
VRGATAGKLGEGDVLIAIEYSSLNYKDTAAAHLGRRRH